MYIVLVVLIGGYNCYDLHFQIAVIPSKSVPSHEAEGPIFQVLEASEVWSK